MNKISRIIALGFLSACGFDTVEPHERAVIVSWGEMSEEILKPGFHQYSPFNTYLLKQDMRQQTEEVIAECFSSDLQQVKIKVRVLYRVPETSTVLILRDYQGSPFTSLVSPRVMEAIKEATALKTAAEIVKTREEIKLASLQASRKKIGDLIAIEDLVIEDVSLSAELEKAIEAKMVQQQTAEKATYLKQQAETDAETAIIKAKAEAESIRIMGEALEKNPKLVDLKMVEKWDGTSPQIVSVGDSGANVLFPINNAKK
jgi:prohibitin 2